MGYRQSIRLRSLSLKNYEFVIEKLGDNKIQAEPLAAKESATRANVGNDMDSWMPWTIARNFIRGFFPTLGLLICWDLWRNLGHGPPRNQVSIAADVVALGVVFAIGFAPPLLLARDQLRHFFQWSAGLGLIVAVLLLTFFSSKVDHKDSLLMIAAYAFYTDLGRICKISPNDVRKKVDFVYKALVFLAVFVSALAAFIRQVWEGTSSPRDQWFAIILIPALIIILAAKWWAGGFEQMPHIQTLDLNERETTADATAESA